MFWIIILILISSYILSFIITKWLNKFCYLKYNTDVVSFFWQCPGINTFAILVFLVGIIITSLGKYYKDDNYYKNKWDNEIK